MLGETDLTRLESLETGDGGTRSRLSNDETCALFAEVRRLQAENAELRATLAAERGEAVGALLGWTYAYSCFHGAYVWGCSGAFVFRHRHDSETGWMFVQRDLLWFPGIDKPWAPTARAAMRAADLAARNQEPGHE